MQIQVRLFFAEKNLMGINISTRLETLVYTESLIIIRIDIILLLTDLNLEEGKERK